MPLKLKNISIKNWLTIKDQHIEFPDYGLVIVNGVNNASNGKMSSVGSGKTALGEAIGRSVLGVDGRFSQLAYYSRRDKGDTRVTTTSDLDGQPLVIDLGYKCKEMGCTGSTLRYTLDGKVTERDRVEHTRDELDSILGLDAELSRWTVYLDGGMLQFGDLSQRGAVDLLMRAMNQPPWDDLYVKAHQEVSQANLEYQRCQVDIQQAVADIQVMTQKIESSKKDLASEESHVEHETLSRQEKLKSLDNDLRQARLDLAAEEAAQRAEQDRTSAIIDKNNAASEQYRRDTAEIDLKLKDLNNALQDFFEKRGEVSSKISALNRRLDELNKPAVASPFELILKKVGTVADLLNGIDVDTENLRRARSIINEILDNYHTKKQEDKLLEDAAKLKSEIETSLQSQATIRDDVTRIRGTIDSLEKEKLELKPKLQEHNPRVLREVAARAAACRSAIEIISEKILEMRQPVKSNAEKISAIMHERELQLNEISAKHDKLIDSMSKISRNLAIAKYWESGFSPAGIPNMILTASVDALNDVSRRISTLMTGGTIVVQYSTTKEQRAGNKPALNISVSNQYGATRVQGNSKGESGLTNLIIAETLAEVGNVSQRVAYRWYDEITNGQDSQVRSSIFAYLKELAANKRMLIFLVDHSPEAANYSDYTLVATKDDSDGGTTTFSWESQR
jgi:DNA repair exonuclease SbcCD ATPase subunit